MSELWERPSKTLFIVEKKLREKGEI